MLFLALLIPPLLMCSVLGLAHYEERMLGPARTTPPPAPAARHLHAVPEPVPEHGAPAGPKHVLRHGKHRRHAA
ncbi:hypothetical protein [Streptomyces sp. G-G2]|uniref:hypothetical protein n=1 Tax=Streptomyces sp. G-G2 TaxID=3046201 RepID=UPI0024B88398|nr:hypothetical protein [Streptomyces sp. G-G2]MDJ0384797.1 hypothetical protein [Streptomyces sp. G-G2]